MARNNSCSRGFAANARAAFRAEHIGFVFQQFHLIPFLDVLDNVLVPQLAGTGDGEALRARALDLLEKFKISIIKKLEL